MKRLVSLFLALWIFNLSVDTDHLQIKQGTSVKKTDDIDDIIELVTEVLPSDIMPFHETNDDGTDDTKDQSPDQVKNITSLLLFCQFYKPEFMYMGRDKKCLQNYFDDNSVNQDVCIDILTPPPNFIAQF